MATIRKNTIKLKIIAVDNGDLNSLEPYTGKQRKAFHGKCLTIIQSISIPGKIHLTASAVGLYMGTLTIDAQ